MIPAVIHSQNVRHTLIQVFKHLEILSSQTAVYRKVFEFAITQLRQLVKSIDQSYSALGEKGDVFIVEILPDLQEIYHLLTQNLLATWTTTILENHVSYVPDQILSIFNSICAKVKKVIPESHFDLLLDTSSDQWSQYNILDMRAIEASFSQCLIGAKENNKPFAKLLTKKLRSIQVSIKESEAALKMTDRSFSPTFSPIPVHYQSFRVRLTDFTILKEIGRGVTAHVFLAKDNRPGIDPSETNVAIKQFDSNKLNGARFQSFQREVAVLAGVQHPALIRMVGATDTPPFCIITEWMPNGSLFHDLKRYHRLDPTMRNIAAFDVARGMQLLHSKQIAHRDLKSLNVLLDKNFHAKVCDFGFSRHTDENMPMTSNIGTPHWMAPELLQHGHTYTNKVDVYAYGIVLWEIATRKIPYQGLDAHTIIKQVKENELRPEIPDNLSKPLAHLIRRCWDSNPELRPTFDEIVRKFKANEIILEGADANAVAKYIEESATAGEVLCEEIELKMSKVINGGITLTEAFKPLKDTQIPPSVVDICWETVLMAAHETISHSEKSILKYNSPAEIAAILPHFIPTSKHGDAAKLLRSLPMNSIPPELLTQFIKEMPTGSEEVDLDITIAACRNGSADLCALYARNPKQIALALDVSCQTGIDSQLHEAVVDKCVASLGNKSLELKVAAARCLLVLGDAKRIPIDSIRKLIMVSKDTNNEENNKLKDTIFALVSLIISGIADSTMDLPSDAISFILEKWPDGRAATAAITICAHENGASKVLSFLENQECNDSEIKIFILKICMMSIRHKNLIPIVKKITEKFNLNDLKEEFEPAVDFLYNEFPLS